MIRSRLLLAALLGASALFAAAPAAAQDEEEERGWLVSLGGGARSSMGCPEATGHTLCFRRERCIVGHMRR